MSARPSDPNHRSGSPNILSYDKVEVALAGVLADASDYEARTLTVFVYLDAAAADREMLAHFGIEGPAPGQKDNVVTPTLSRRQTAELSQLAWVRQLRLWGRLRLLQDHQLIGG